MKDDKPVSHRRSAVLHFASILLIIILTFLGAFEKVRKATISFVNSLCLSAWNNSVPTGRIFTKFNF
jgi:hypothetical protein